ncbi:MAG: UvrD-helicase domain-containing protein [Deferribacteraceae bacterium]|jgi:exodeoxyribonuclease V beta subunit|nr:UvrD-helicase domain-containing protein [Deferribacteraceae bacterium]
MKRVDPGYNIALMASAGTGKTYNLALRVAAILMRDTPEYNLYDSSGTEVIGALKTYSHGKTLCLTFTRKATAEMQNRVHEFLSNIAAGVYNEESDQYRSLTQTLGITNAEEIRKKAENALKRIYNDSGLLQIRTIDSFTSMILRLFPFEANLRPDFRIINPSTEKSLKNQAFVDAFDNLSAPLLYNNLFSEYIAWTEEQPYKFTDRLDKQVEWIIERSVTLEDELRDAAGLTVNSIAELLKRAKNIDKLVVSALTELLNLIKSCKLEKNVSAVSLRRFPLINSISAGEKTVSALFEDESAINYLSPSKIVSEKKSGLLPDEYKNIYTKLTGYVKDRVKLTERLDLDIALHIAVYVHNALDRLKKTRGFMSYADLTRAVYLLMNQKNYQLDNDYLYFRLDGRLEHILIDEFQDTSDVQWSILRPLAEEAMAGLSQSDKVGSFFCVGDPKQTIYRFRGSNPGFFQSVIREYGSKLTKENLAVNYRSDRNIVDFVNTLFSDADEFIGGGEILKFEHNEQRARSDNDGYVSIRSAVGENSAEIEKNRLETLGKLMLELISSGWSINDIAILVSKKEDGVTAFKYLKNIMKIDSRLGFAEFLISRPAFVIVEALVSYMYNRDTFSLFAFLLAEPSVVPQNTVQSENAFKRHKLILDKYLDKTQGESVYNRILNIGEHLSLNRRLGNDPDYKTLLGIIAQNLPDVANIPLFLTGIREAAAETAASGVKTGGVKIMTIHGAKGLEFPAVILFDVNESFNINQNTTYFIDRPAGQTPVMRKRLAKKYSIHAPDDYTEAINREKILTRYEKVNQLYVATTRAKNALFIFVKRSNRECTDSYILERFPDFYDKGVLTPVSSAGYFHSKPVLSTEPFLTFCRNVLLKPLKYKDHPEKIQKEVSDALKNFPVSTPVSERVIRHTNKILSDRTLSGGYGKEPYSSRFYGIFIHEIIYQMENFTPEALPPALKKALNRYGGYIAPSAAQTAEISINLLLVNKKWKEITDGAAIFREKSVFYDGRLLVIDLYAVKNDRLTVIDFKTGDPESNRHDEYAGQVKMYADALSKQYGMASEGYLLYLNHQIFYRVDI